MCECFKRPDWDEYFMLQAELAKLRSNCISRKVGAVIVRDRRQVATGYNGTPPGISNCYEGGCARCQRRVEGKIRPGEELERCLCNHAEANAIMHCAILGIEATGTRGATMYTTYVPCLECTKMAITIGIKRFVCLEDYPEDDLGLAGQSGIEVTKIDRDKIRDWASVLVRDNDSEDTGDNCCDDCSAGIDVTVVDSANNDNTDRRAGVNAVINEAE